MFVTQMLQQRGSLRSLVNTSRELIVQSHMPMYYQLVLLLFLKPIFFSSRVGFPLRPSLFLALCLL